MPRSRILKVRLSEEEYEQLKAFAERHHITLSAFVRGFIVAIPALEKSEQEPPQESQPQNVAT